MTVIFMIRAVKASKMMRVFFIIDCFKLMIVCVEKEKIIIYLFIYPKVL